MRCISPVLRKNAGNTAKEDVGSVARYSEKYRIHTHQNGNTWPVLITCHFSQSEHFVQLLAYETEGQTVGQPHRGGLRI